MIIYLLSSFIQSSHMIMMILRMRSTHVLGIVLDTFDSLNSSTRYRIEENRYRPSLTETETELERAFYCAPRPLIDRAPGMTQLP